MEVGRAEAFGGALFREIWGNWMVCAIANHSAGDENFTLTSDPSGGDGLIYNRATGEVWPTEHVMVHPRAIAEGSSTEDNIIAAIEHKTSRGAEYAQGKTLVVFSYAPGGEWFPRRIRRRLPADFLFYAAWVFGLQDAAGGSYIYGITQIARAPETDMIWHVIIDQSFEDWRVERIQ